MFFFIEFIAKKSLLIAHKSKASCDICEKGNKLWDSKSDNLSFYEWVCFCWHNILLLQEFSLKVYLETN